MPGRFDPPPAPRRDFLGILGLLTAAIAMLGSLLGMLRLPKPRVTPEASSRVRIGKPQDYPPGSDRVLPALKLRVVSTERGISAMSLVCTHLGCISKKAETGYACPCHGSRFGNHGEVIAGPAPRALRWLAISQAADGTLIVDTAKEVPADAAYLA